MGLRIGQGPISLLVSDVWFTKMGGSVLDDVAEMWEKWSIVISRVFQRTFVMFVLDLQRTCVYDNYHCWRDSAELTVAFGTSRISTQFPVNCFFIVTMHLLTLLRQNENFPGHLSQSPILQVCAQFFNDRHWQLRLSTVAPLGMQDRKGATGREYGLFFLIFRPMTYFFTSRDQTLQPPGTPARKRRYTLRVCYRQRPWSDSSRPPVSSVSSGWQEKSTDTPNTARPSFCCLWLRLL